MKIYIKKLNLIKWISLALIFLCVIFNIYGQNLLLNGLSIFAFTVYSLMLFKTAREIMKVYYLLFLLTAGGVLSVFLIEYQAIYLNEIQVNAYNIGATPLLVFYIALFSEFLVLFSSFFIQKTTIQKKVEYNQDFFLLGMLVFTFSILLILYYVIIKNGSPLFSGIDKFHYIKQYFTPFTLRLSSYLLIFSSFTLGFLYSCNKYRKGCVVGVCLILLFFILRGEKFGGIVFSSFYFLCPVLIKKEVFFKFSIKFVFVIILLMLIFTFSIFINYYNKFNNVDKTITQFQNRIAGQGQLWWRIVELKKYKTNIYDNKDIDRQFYSKNKYGTGMDYLMQKAFVDYNRYNVYKKANVRLTFAFPAILEYFFNYWQIIILIIFYSFYSSLIFSLLYKAVIANDYFLSIMVIKLYSMLLEIIAMGNLYFLLKTTNLFVLFILTVYLLTFYNIKIRFKIPSLMKALQN